MRKLVKFEEATDAELQIAGKFSGIDEMGRIGEGLIEADTLTPEGRTMLIAALRECGNNCIQIDPNNRVTDSNALVPFDVALPIE